MPTEGRDPVCFVRVDLDEPDAGLPPAERRGLAFTLRLRSSDFGAARSRATELVRRAVDDNPHSTLVVMLEPIGPPERLAAELLEELLAVCYRTTSYLDRFYSMHPGELLGAKRLVVVLSGSRASIDPGWLEAVERYATPVWRREGTIPADR